MLTRVQAAQILDFHEAAAANADKIKAEREKFMTDNCAVFDKLKEIDTRLSKAQENVVITRDALGLDAHCRARKLSEEQLKDEHEKQKALTATGGVKPAVDLDSLFGSISKAQALLQPKV